MPEVLGIYFTRDERFNQPRRCHVTVTEGTTREQAEAIVEKLKAIWPDREYAVFEPIPTSANQIL